MTSKRGQDNKEKACDDFDDFEHLQATVERRRR